jgi:hypothetical protein
MNSAYEHIDETLIMHDHRRAISTPKVQGSDSEAFGMMAVEGDHFLESKLGCEHAISGQPSREIRAKGEASRSSRWELWSAYALKK